MPLTKLLLQKKSEILEKWRDLLFDSYPPETRMFLKKEKDRFQNPLAYRLTQGLAGLFTGLLQGMEPGQIKAQVDEIIRIKALQDVAPSHAIAFIFLLKQLIRGELAAELQQDSGLEHECRELEAQIDGLALLSFDAYMERREKLYEIRVAEVKKRVSGWMRRAGLSLEEQPPGDT